MTTIQATPNIQDYPLLRRTLQANGIFSTVSGLLFTFAAGSVATFLGNIPAWIIMATGIILLAFAADLFYLSLQREINRTFVTAIIASDIIWVVGSAILLFTNWVTLTTPGFWAVAIVADIVAVFAALQWYGLRRK